MASATEICHDTADTNIRRNVSHIAFPRSALERENHRGSATLANLQIGAMKPRIPQTPSRLLANCFRESRGGNSISF